MRAAAGNSRADIGEGRSSAGGGEPRSWSPRRRWKSWGSSMPIATTSDRLNVPAGARTRTRTSTRRKCCPQGTASPPTREPIGICLARFRGMMGSHSARRAAGRPCQAPSPLFKPIPAHPSRAPLESAGYSDRRGHPEPMLGGSLAFRRALPRLPGALPPLSTTRRPPQAPAAVLTASVPSTLRPPFGRARVREPERGIPGKRSPSEGRPAHTSWGTGEHSGPPWASRPAAIPPDGKPDPT